MNGGTYDYGLGENVLGPNGERTFKDDSVLQYWNILDAIE